MNGSVAHELVGATAVLAELRQRWAGTDRKRAEIIRQVKRDALWQHAGYSSFGDCCGQVFGISKRHADRLLAFSRVCDAVRPTGLDLIERQAREYLPLLEERGAKAVAELHARLDREYSGALTWRIAKNEVAAILRDRLPDAAAWPDHNALDWGVPYALGRHRLLFGDSTIPEHVYSLLAQVKVGHGLGRRPLWDRLPRDPRRQTGAG